MTIDQENELLSSVRDIKLAVQGDEKIGITGLVHDVSVLRQWRLQIDGRILLISGFVMGAVFLAKYIWLKIM